MAVINAREKIENIVLKYAELLKKEYDLYGIYLYGSYAKNSSYEDSDIDIVVVSDSFTGDVFDDRLNLMKVRRSVDNRIEPHPFKISEFRKDNPLAREVMETGIRIV